MTNEIKKTLEGLKRIVEELSILRGVYSNDQLALLQSIKWGEALDQARKELGEKKTIGKIEGALQFTYSEDIGYNEMHDIARPILAKAKLRIALIEQANRAANKIIEEEINLKTEALLKIDELSNSAQFRRVEEQQKKIEELEKSKEEILKAKMIIKGILENRELALQSIKEKLTKDNIEGTVHEIYKGDYSVDDYEIQGDDGVYLPTEHERMLITDYSVGLVEAICEALIKYLTGGKE